MENIPRKPMDTRPRYGVARWPTKIGVSKPRRRPTTDFDRLAASIPLDELYAMFTGKVSWYAVKAWRYGERQAPPWAFDILRNRLESDAHKLLELAAMGERAKKEGR